MGEKQAAWVGRRNSHIRLLTEFLNFFAIGIMGASIIGPILEPNNPAFMWDAQLWGGEKLKSLADSATSGAVSEKDEWLEPSIFDIIQWSGVSAAIAFHLVCHAITRLIRPGTE